MQTVNRFKWVLASLVFAAILIIVIFGLFSIDNATNKMVIGYIESLGWKIEHTPIEISHLTLPKQFNEVFNTYNAVQQSSGFDLAPYKGKSVSRYSYRVLNHSESASNEVIASIIVYENRIIAGDISSSSANGFMHGICETANMKND